MLGKFAAVSVNGIVKVSKERRELSAIFFNFVADGFVELRGCVFLVKFLRPNQMLLNDIINRQLTITGIFHKEIKTVHKIIHNL